MSLDLERQHRWEDRRASIYAERARHRRAAEERGIPYMEQPDLPLTAPFWFEQTDTGVPTVYEVVSAENVGVVRARPGVDLLGRSTERVTPKPTALEALRAAEDDGGLSSRVAAVKRKLADAVGSQS